MKKIIFLVLINLLFTCKGKSISDKEDLIEIQKIIKENFDSEFEVYTFSLEASTLGSNLDYISREYKVNNLFFKDRFIDNGFSDPVKILGDYNLKKKTAFKIEDIDISIIPIKYEEALNILAEKQLLRDNTSYYLNSWTFEADKNGDIFSRFTLQYTIGSSSTGKVTTINYDSHYFNVDKNNKLIFNK